MQHSSHTVDSASVAPDGRSEHRRAASHARELDRYRRAELQLRNIIALNARLLRQKDETIRHQALLRSEADHRILNDLQMIVSMLSLQSRSTANAEACSQLATAAHRIAMIGRIHRRLHSFDGATTVAFKKFLMDLCGDFSALVGSGLGERDIVVEAGNVDLPTSTCRPLGLIANELITNAVKYGTGRITVTLEANPERGCALWVSNDGPALPEEFDPAASKGMGMRIIRSFVERIGGELVFGRGDNGRGARFTVLFPEGPRTMEVDHVAEA